MVTILFKCHFDNYPVYLKRMSTLRSIKKFLFSNFYQKDFLISGPVTDSLSCKMNQRIRLLAGP